MTRVLVGANSAVVRAGLESTLAMSATFQIVGSFSISKAMARFEDLQPDAVLLVLDAPADDSVLVAIEGGVALGSSLVILTDDSEKFLSADALHSGVRAILPREAKPEEILAAVNASVAGLIVTHPDILEVLLVDPPEGSDLDASDQILTARESQVLGMIADGLGNKEIASKLGISDHTVKFHISSVLAKLGASNRAEAVTLGIRLGLIMI